MVKNLVIVESPAKAKTIEKFLGKDFTVRSCYGHIRDLGEDGLSVNVEKDFEPLYVVPDEKKKVVNELQGLAKQAETVWLATDEDREGEAISWHLAETLNLDAKTTNRIVFHEITKPAILRAIESPRRINEDLVNAQQARRVLDRLVGFELSPVLWKKVKPALSAGRVQSVAVRLIVDREREIINFKSKSSFRVTASFHPVLENGKISEAVLQAELPQKFDTEAEAREFLEKCREAAYKITDIEVKPAYRSPAPPFTTSTLQQEASRKLGYSVTRTMSLAQKLYEAGHITYMRTDSVNLSELAIGEIEKEITRLYGASYSKPRRYTTKSDSAQEAHEAIRPTYVGNQTAGSDDGERRLYDLIWKRTVASQMANAQLERTNVKINISTHAAHLLATGEVLKFEGFLKVYLESRDEDEGDEDVKGMLPPLSVGQGLSSIEMAATERYSRPAGRYTEASLVRKLEELGIGRPSTYAPTINVVQKRGYVEKGEQEGEERNIRIITLKNGTLRDAQKKETFGKERGKLFPSNIGIIVSDFLTEHFRNILDYGFTAGVEKEFDEIARGEREWHQMLKQFYGPFHENVEKTLKNTSVVRGERLLGTDPKTGQNIHARMGKFGPHVQLGDLVEGGPKPQYAKLRSGQLLETITLDDALELFKLPRELGEFEGEPVVANVGRFGPYVSHGKAFYSLGKEDDPYSVEYERAVEIIVQKRTEKANKLIKEFEYEGKPMQVLQGRFGPYVCYDKINATIPKATDPASLTLEDAVKLIEAKKAAPPKAGRGAARGRTKSAESGSASTAKPKRKAAPKK